MTSESSAKNGERNGKSAEITFRQFLRTFGLLERVMQAHFTRFGISGAKWGFLRTLHRAEQAGEPGLRLTDLSDRMLIRPPSVSQAVDRLERAGLVERRGSPTDLRAKQVGLTDKGRQLVEQVLTVHQSRIDAVLGGLTTAQQVELNHLLERLRKHLESLLEQDVGRPS